MKYALAHNAILALCQTLQLDPERIAAMDIKLRPGDIVRLEVTLLPDEPGVEAAIVELVKQPEFEVAIDDGP